MHSKPFLGFQLEEKSEAHDIEHGISTSVYQEANHCLQDENPTLQHELPVNIKISNHKIFSIQIPKRPQNK